MQLMHTLEVHFVEHLLYCGGYAYDSFVKSPGLS